MTLQQNVEPTPKQRLRAAIDAERRRRLGLRQRDQPQMYCQGVTHLGEPCRWRARATGYCHWHERTELATT